MLKKLPKNVNVRVASFGYCVTVTNLFRIFEETLYVLIKLLISDMAEE